jgi:glycosyltransferase involved in cell wall biosynthesis
MDLVVALDYRFHITPDGRVWTANAFAHSFWTRYLEVFDRVRIVARAAPVGLPGPGDRRVDGECVSFAPVPFYLGPLQYLRKARAVRRAAIGAIGDGDAVILRVGSELAASIAPAMQRAGRPYGVEVVGDPYDAFAPGAIHHPLRAFFRRRNTRLLRRQCAGACGAAYVTEFALQRRYPCAAHMTAASDVELAAAFRTARPVQPPARSRLIFVGSLEQMYKAPDVLIDAMAICLREDPSFCLTVVGEGRHQAELERRAAALGIAGHIRFAGRLSSAAVLEELDRSSLFVLPSRTEGLPRAMLEAMARGLPSIGSAVGGIPELLNAEDLVPPGDSGALARRILEVARDPRRMERMSLRNRQRALAYREEILGPRRTAFYRHVADRTQEWMKLHDREVAGDACTPCRENI